MGVPERHDGHPLDWYPMPITAAERQAWADGDDHDSLALIDKARAALRQAQTLADIYVVREIAERARKYAVAARLGREAENHAARLRIEAERKAGQTLAAMPKHPGGRPKKTPSESEGVPRLRDMAITERQSHEWQLMARLADDVLEQHVEEVTRAGKTLTADSVLEIARKQARRERALEIRVPATPEDLPADVTVEVGDAEDLPLADESVHLIVTSPPYGVGVGYDGGDVPSDAWPAFMYRWLREAHRVAVEHGRLALNVPLDTVTGGYRPTYAEAVQMALAAGWTYRSSIVWIDDHLGKSVARGSVDSPSAPHVIAGAELVALFSKGDWRREPPCAPDIEHEDWISWTSGVWRFPGEPIAWEGHPAPFPLELPRRLVLLLSFPGDVVLDPFVGSGTTAVAAHQLGRRFYGFDRSRAYVASTLRRVAR